MDPKGCSKLISVCENSSDSAGDKGQSSGSISKKVCIEEQNDSRMVIDGVRCSNLSTHTEEVGDNLTAVSCHHEAESYTSKAKTKEFHTVDLSCGGESDNRQSICRICHFGSDQSPADGVVSGESVSPDLIEIGCKCKNELGLAHSHCAEAWFKLRGNSVCEICGCTAKNVTVRLMEEERNEERDSTLDERSERGKSCYIFMVFLLAIFFLHWFYKKMSDEYDDR